MASGVKVCDKVQGIINEMKIVKSGDVDEERIRLVIFWIHEGVIVVKRTVKECELEGKDAFEHFKDSLESEICCYVLYDCHFETEESSKKEELVFACWCPDSAKIKDKMLYSSSANAIKKLMSGVKHQMQLNDYTDCQSMHEFACTLEKKCQTRIQKLEGKKCHNN